MKGIRTLLVGILLLAIATGTVFAMGEPEGLTMSEAELKFYSWAGAGPGHEMDLAYIEWFEGKYPGVTIKYENPQGNIHQTIFTDFAAGTAPDVFYMGGRELEQYEDLGIVTSLERFIVKDPNFSLEGTLDVAVDYFRLNRDPNEDLYALPIGWTTYLLYFNKTLFAEAGLETPDKLYARGEWNLENFLKAVRKLAKDTDGDGRNDQFGWEVPAWYGNTFQLIGANGGEAMFKDGKLTYDTNAVKEVYQLIHDLRFKENVIPGPGDIDGYEAFPSGIIGMQISGNWTMARLDALDADWDWGVTMLPKAAQNYTNLYSNGITLSSKTKNPDQAWAFIRDFAAGEGGRLIAEGNISFPMMESHFKSMNALPVWLESMKWAKPVPRHVKMTEIGGVVGKYHSAYMEDPNASLDEMVKNIMSEGAEVLAD